MNSRTTVVLVILLIAATLSIAARLDPDHPQSNTKEEKANKGGGGGGGGDYGGYGGYFGPGGGVNIPGFGNVGGGGGYGYGAGYGGPKGGYARGGVVRPTVVCKEKGPCYKKKLTCPAKCFSSYSRSGKGYGYGGGGGGCTIDCTKKCIAYC